MQNPAVVVALKEGGEFKCDLRVEEIMCKVQISNVL